MFVAKLADGTSKVSAGNDTGLWATDSSGKLRLILREGQMVLPGWKLENFTVPGAVGGSPGQRRARASGDESARIIWAEFAGGGSAISTTAVP